MKIWLITDTHFNHTMLIEKGFRPANFEERIEKNIKSSVKEDDILIHLGDICMGRDGLVHEEIISKINCKKWLVRGNHDGKSDQWYIKNGWDFVGKRIYLKKFGQNITLSHKPVEYDHWYTINIHGHFHDNDHRTYEPELIAISNDKQKLLAIENTNYCPVLLEKFILGFQK